MQPYLFHFYKQQKQKKLKSQSNKEFISNLKGIEVSLEPSMHIKLASRRCGCKHDGAKDVGANGRGAEEVQGRRRVKVGDT